MSLARLRGKPRRGWFVKGFVGVCLVVLAVLMGALGFTLAVVSEFSKGLPDVDKLRSYEPSETTYIYSADGKVIASLYKENRVWVPFEKIPDVVKNAFIAIEDRRFYQHVGVDPKGIFRAVKADLEGGTTEQGASTITMQLTRAVFLSPEQTKERKIREILLAMQIEKRFTKPEILEFYLNQIYFGAGAYGVQAAAHTYFNKNVKDLTLDEAACLAGLPAAPSEYSPLVNPQKAKARQMLVLDSMADDEVHFITKEEANAAKSRTIVTVSPKKQQNILKYPYFTTYVIHELSQKYPEDLLYRGGLRVYTTLDTRLQNIGQKAVIDGVERAQKGGFNTHQAALACVEVGTGYIKALVGGTQWDVKNQFNRAWQSTRQPGSAFKVFVYSTAMEYGYTPDSTVVDAPVSFKVSEHEVYTPKNSDGKFAGALPIWKAIEVSRDIPAIRMANQVGLDRVIDVANRMGIKEHIDPNLSIGLGAVDVTPLEMASAYTVLPNLGLHIEPTPIKLIKDLNGNIIEDNRYPYKEPVLSEATCTNMIDCMKKVIEAGTGTAAQIGRPAAGKTGTTDEHRDAWFCGFTPEYSVAVWTGNDDYSRTGAFGGDVAAPIWGDFMKAALEKKPVRNFGVVENGKVGFLMCADTHRRAASTCPNTYREFFKPGEEPESWCRIHTIDTVGGGRFAHLNRGNMKNGIHSEEVEVKVPERDTPKPKAKPAAPKVDAPPPEPPPDEPAEVRATPIDPEVPIPVDIQPPAPPAHDAEPPPPAPPPPAPAPPAPAPSAPEAPPATPM